MGAVVSSSQKQQNKEMAINKGYTIVKRIGKDSYGCDYEAVYLPSRSHCVIKCYKNFFNVEEILKENAREIEILSKIDHPNIIHTYDVIRGKEGNMNDIFLVLELLPADLLKKIYSPNNMSRLATKKVMYGLLCGVNYLHSRKIVHRDIKPENILIKSENDIRLCNFGLSTSLYCLENVRYDEMYYTDYISKVCTKKEAECDFSEGLDEGTSVNSRVLSEKNSKNIYPATPLKKDIFNMSLTKHTTRYYRAPEIILLESYFSAVDIWAVGCVFAELLQLFDINRCADSMGPLFTGESCFPLNPPQKCQAFNYENNQLHKICKIIGKPTNEDSNFIRSKKAKQKISNMPNYKPIQYESLFPGIQQKEKDLLAKMLVFNPFKRITAKQALNHPYFEEVRTISRETEGAPLFLETENYPEKCFNIVQRICKKTDAVLY